MLAAGCEPRSSCRDATFRDLRTIAFAGDGSLWFEDNGRGSIGVRTGGGIVRERPLPDAGQPLAMTLCNGRAWVVSSAGYGRTITLYKTARSLGSFEPVRRLVNGWASLACDAKHNVWYASAAFQAVSRIGRIDIRGGLRELDLPLWNAKIYDESDGSIWVTGLNNCYTCGGAQLIIARVDDDFHLVSPRTLPRGVNFDYDYSLAVTDARTAWINLAFPHSVLRMQLVAARVP